jgi:glycosyltransferase involved in cell wall biosynthesis
MRVPTVGALHFTPDQMSRMVTGKSDTVIRSFAEWYIQTIYNRYSAIMVPTQTFLKFLHTIGVRKQIRVVSNGVDTTIYTPSSEKEKSRNTGVMFLYIGRIDEDKNVMTLVNAMQYVSSEVMLTIAGNGKQKESLIQLAKTLNVDHKIVWKGSISEAQMIQLYKQADCFTIMAEFEIQSIVTLQALASGLPVVGADAGALPELIHDGENGYLVGTHDAKKLGDKMNYLAAHPQIRRKMGEQSRKISLVHHKPTVLARLEELYREVIRHHVK